MKTNLTKNPASFERPFNANTANTTPQANAIRTANNNLQHTLKKHCPSLKSMRYPPIHECESTLVKAVKSNKIQKIRELIATSPNDVFDVNPNGENAIHIAAQLGLTEAVEALIGSDINSEASMIDNFGRTPLHAAIANGHMKTAHKILSISAFESFQWGVDHVGKSPIDYATEAGDLALAQKMKFKRKQAALLLPPKTKQIYNLLDNLNHQQRALLTKKEITIYPSSSKDKRSNKRKISSRPND